MRCAAHLIALVALTACNQLRQGAPNADAATDAADVVEAVADVAAQQVDTGPPRPCVWVDESGSGRDGTLVDFNGTASSGFTGAGTPADPTALVFDGADDRVDPVGDPMHLAREFSVAVWVRLRSNSGLQTVFSNRSTRDAADDYTGFVIYMNTASWRSIYFTGYYTASIDWEHHAPARANVDVWTHLVTTLSLTEGFARFYVDGALISERLATRPLRYNAAARPHVGGETGGDFLRGSVGLVRAWSRGLSRDEVVDEFRATAPRFDVAADAPTGPVGEADALRYERACPR